jgi:Cu(I)/Ag(I) efflux system periplasmic protein CusF
LKKQFLNVVFASGMLALGAGSAWAAGDHAEHQAGTANASASATMTSGEVRKVDTDQGKVTLKHEAITNLDMPGMTMIFRADKPEMLKDLKVGDKVRFHAESVGGAIVVTHIEPSN